MKDKKVLIISGATATGKTQYSLRAATQMDAEIVNFDSLLFYKELNIGTAKPNTLELNSIPHHLVNCESINAPLNAADFQRKAVPIIQSIHQAGRAVILVGGSGFYLQTLLKGMYKGGRTPVELRDRSDKLYQDQGINPFLKILQEHDPKSFERYHPNDHYRIRRAVEFYWHNQSPFSQQRALMPQNFKEAPAVEHEWQTYHLHLDIDKPTHFEIIQQRTEKMLRSGLIEEVEQLLAKGFDESLKPLNSIGYKETIAYLNGQINSKEELTEKINISTRQLAKAQRTWFKRLNWKTYHSLDDEKLIHQKIQEIQT